MKFGDAWARSYRNGRIIGTILLIPVLYVGMKLAIWTMSDRLTVVLTTPRDVSALLNGDPIPKGSAVTYAKHGVPLEYRFGIDEGTYTLRVVAEGTGQTLQDTLVLDHDRGSELYVTVTESDDGLVLEKTY